MADYDPSEPEYNHEQPDEAAFALVYGRIETLLQKAQAAENRVDMLVDMGRISGVVQTLLDLKLTNLDRVQVYLDRLNGIVALAQMNIVAPVDPEDLV